MILFWIGIAVLYCVIVFFLHKIFYKEVRDEEYNRQIKNRNFTNQIQHFSGVKL